MSRQEDDLVCVCLDGPPENLVPWLALRATRVLEDRWNGWLRPLATAEAFGSFLDAWRANDPNGIWGYATEVGDVLMCTRTDDDWPAEEFPQSGATDDGTALYDLTGWAWMSLPDVG